MRCSSRLYEMFLAALWMAPAMISLPGAVAAQGGCSWVTTAGAACPPSELWRWTVPH